MIEYILARDGWGYLPDSGEIEISNVLEDYSRLTDSEISTVISDSIIHEYIHYLLHKEFNLVVSELFDTIGHLFYSDFNLSARISKIYYDGVKLQEWKDVIEEHGIQEFYDRYNISNYDLIIANNICKEV